MLGWSPCRDPRRSRLAADTGFLLEVAACKRAVILAGCEGSTRGSLIPAVNKNTWIRDTVLDVLICIHRIEPFKAVGICDSAELGNIRGTIGCKFHPQRVGTTYADQCSRKQVGPLCDGSSDQNPAGAGAFAGET